MSYDIMMKLTDGLTLLKSKDAIASNFWNHGSILSSLQDEKKADLEMSFEYCGVVDRTWTTIGIIIGCILAAIAIIAIVAVIVMKKRYEQVRTNES